MVWVVIVVVAIVVLLLLFLVGMFNKLVRLRNRAENAWAQVDVQLRKRYDLIPNLVETVKGYAAHERGTFEAVTNARVAAQQAQGVAQQAEAENMLTAALGRLFAVAEAYPQLRATENFQQLQAQLSEVEQSIAVSRQVLPDRGCDSGGTAGLLHRCAPAARGGTASAGDPGSHAARPDELEAA